MTLREKRNGKDGKKPWNAPKAGKEMHNGNFARPIADSKTCYTRSPETMLSTKLLERIRLLSSMPNFPSTTSTASASTAPCSFFPKRHEGFRAVLD